MNLIERLKGAIDGFQGKSAAPNLYPVRAHEKQTGLMDYTDRTKMLESYVSWVYACVTIRARSVAQAMFRVYRGDSEEELVGHPIVQLFKKVNPIDTRFDLFFRTICHLDLVGEAFWYIPKNGMGMPGEIWTLPPDKVKIIPASDNTIKGYELKYPDRTISFTADEVVFFKYPDPGNVYRGVAPLAAAARSVDIDTFQHEYQRRFYSNYAVPPLVLQTDQVLNDGTVMRLKESWLSAYGGDNVMKTPAVLDAGLKANVIGVPQKDLAWMDSNRLTRDDILAIFSVPASKLGLVEDVNRANAEANDYTFAVNVIEPILVMFDERLTQDVAERYYDTGITVRHDSTVPKDEETSARVARARIEAGLTTINEERAAEGYGGVEGGDVVLVSSVLKPLASMLNEAEPDDEEPDEEPEEEEGTPEQPEPQKEEGVKMPEIHVHHTQPISVNVPEVKMPPVNFDVKMPTRKIVNFLRNDKGQIISAELEEYHGNPA